MYVSETAHGEAQPEGAQEVVSRSLQGEAGACEGDQGRVRTALVRHSAVDLRMQREQARTVRSVQYSSR